MMNKIYEEAGRSILKQIAKEAATRSFAIVLVEALRAKLYVLREVELQRELRKVKLEHRQNDLEWEEHVARRKAAWEAELRETYGGSASSAEPSTPEAEA